jgi:Spy/CpxP family protein refolding chaperone
MRRWWTMLIALCALSLAAPAAAQPDNQPGIKNKDKDKARKDKGPKDQRRRLAKLRGRLLRSKLGLSEDKATKVEAILDKYQPEHAEVQRDTMHARQTLRQLFREDSNDQDAYAAALTKLEQATTKGMQLKQQQFGELKKVLTPKEQAKLLHAMQKLRQHIAKRRGARGQRGPRGGRPRGGPPGNRRQGKQELGF